MLHTYDSQMRSVLFRRHKQNKNIFINQSLVHGCRLYAVVIPTGQNCSGPHVTSHVDTM